MTKLSTIIAIAICLTLAAAGYILDRPSPTAHTVAISVTIPPHLRGCFTPEPYRVGEKSLRSILDSFNGSGLFQKAMLDDSVHADLTQWMDWQAGHSMEKFRSKFKVAIDPKVDVILITCMDRDASLAGRCAAALARGFIREYETRNLLHERKLRELQNRKNQLSNQMHFFKDDIEQLKDAQSTPGEAADMASRLQMDEIELTRIAHELSLVQDDIEDLSIQQGNLYRYRFEIVESRQMRASARR